MEQREIMEQVNKMLSDNPAKIIKIRDAFDEMFEGRNIGSAQAISDREYERIRYIFRDIDVPLSWCTNKAAVYQLYKAVKTAAASTARLRNLQDLRRRDFSAVSSTKLNSACYSCQLCVCEPAMY